MAPGLGTTTALEFTLLCEDKLFSLKPIIFSCLESVPVVSAQHGPKLRHNGLRLEQVLH